MRTKEEEENIIWNIYDELLDDEDLGYMKEAFESLHQVANKEVEPYSWTNLSRIFFACFLYPSFLIVFSVLADDKCFIFVTN